MQPVNANEHVKVHLSVLYTRGKPEEASEMAEPISAAYMHWPHSTFTLSSSQSTPESSHGH